MNRRIGSEHDDARFFFARRVERDVEAGRWRIDVRPDDCIVSARPTDEPVPTVADLRAERPSVSREDGVTRYEGRVLLSAGVVALVDGRQVLLRRGDDAPTAPGKWTSPAGRCDRDPGTTALKELYEELAVLLDGSPAFVRLGDRSDELRSVYARTLERIGRHRPESEWVDLDAVPRHPDELETVVTTYGDRRYEDAMFARYVPDANTLELRFVVGVETDGESLELLDGEFDRRVEAFSPDELAALPREKLVPTDARFVEEVVAPGRD